MIDVTMTLMLGGRIEDESASGRWIAGTWSLVLAIAGLIGVDVAATVSGEDSPPARSIEQERLETMRNHSSLIKFHAKAAGFPPQLVDQPLFRYDDLARGYVDGAVWRLGAEGRPKAIVTTELHPKYDNHPRIVYDFLSLSEAAFTATLMPGVQWSPAESAVEMKLLPDGPKLAATKPQRLFQLKKMSERFQGQQIVEGQQLELRLLPRPIDRYQPFAGDDCDGAIFVFVSGRNPGLVLLIEAKDTDWKYGVGRLSGPSSLNLNLDGSSIWNVSPSTYTWTSAYTASNFAIVVPGFLTLNSEHPAFESRKVAWAFAHETFGGSAKLRGLKPTLRSRK